ncbi:MAG: hypothetical protein A3A33_00065 [Candidatus Yanofskybacteria bacterium RIFCSPLOWO2_01_FULL_49_25]|uniref:Glycosyltransferase 2-like domain-containing protein n=1 Tax=Candidatus Yanofskybacteria bacterium RIFCSPLOWO2_01_FULL_49_25 TaxID=1802701 RepID=A0A1F8GX69_9BACT|nr:MAG: hypothetical protein A3A33_00065 [Candidatus Yanofskybacteria bacterium RIFCSPLOWO2_01_FULL_49_25]
MHDYLTIGKAGDLKNPRERALYRFFEMVPGLLSWTTLILIVVASFHWPIATVIFIIIFDTYWLVKSIYLTFHLRASFSRMRGFMKMDWLSEVEKLDATRYTLHDVRSWRDIYHLVILPTYQEPTELIVQSIESLAKSHYPMDRMIVVLAQEERAGREHNEGIASAVGAQFKNVFFRLAVVEHPDGIAGELAGKGANIAYAGKHVQREIIDQLAIPYQRIMASVFDIDTVVHAEYFSRLTYIYLTSDDPLHASYQPIPFFTNNIWEAPAFARVVSFSSTFWQTIQQERVENLITFSSHSMPFQAVVDIGFWQSNMVNEDSRVFWQCFLRYDGNYRVVPLYFPVYLDANVAPSFWRTMINIHKQHRRWGYGVENIPYFWFGFLKNKKIPRSKKYFYSLITLEGHWSWATNAIMLFLLGWLPLLVGGSAFNQTVVAFNLPFVTRMIMFGAMFGLVTSAILSMLILPPRPPQFGKFKYLWMILQWILFPVTTILFGCFPSLEAQTRLMLGKYLGFWVTPKHRVGKSK